MSHRRLGHRFKDDWSEDELKNTFKDIKSAVTVPVNIAIEGKHVVLDLGRVEKLLKDARLIVISECGCRTEHRNCSAPLDVCISLDEDAEGMLRSGEYNVRRSSVSEVLDALEKGARSRAGPHGLRAGGVGQDQPNMQLLLVLLPHALGADPVRLGEARASLRPNFRDRYGFVLGLWRLRGSMPIRRQKNAEWKNDI